MIETWDLSCNKTFRSSGVWTSDAHKTEPSALRSTSTPVARLRSAHALVLRGARVHGGQQLPGTSDLQRRRRLAEPYPARYPIYVSSGQTAASVHLKITGGVPSGGRVLWLRNGVTTVTDTPGTTSYDATKSIALSGRSPMFAPSSATASRRTRVWQ